MYTVNKDYHSNMSNVFVPSIDTIHERACNRMRFRNSRGNLQSTSEYATAWKNTDGQGKKLI